MSTPRHSGTPIFLLALASASVLVAPDQQRPVFRTSTDLVVIDALVVGRDGAPIEGLSIERFEVFVDGQRRPVVSAEFVRSADGERAAGNRLNAQEASGVPDGRVILLAIDQASFPASAQAAAREAATRVVDGVNASDYLGLVAFPGQVEVPPTRDRTQVRGAIPRIAGLRVDALTSRFNLSAADAVALKSREPVTTKAIIARECRTDAFNPTCPHEVIQEGSSIADALEHQAMLSLTGLGAVIDALSAVPGRKTLIVISAGLPFSTGPGSKLNLASETDTVARRAAAANVDLYVLYMNIHFMRHFSAAFGRQNQSIFQDIGLFGYGLERFADTGGGALFQVEVDSDPFVDRILRETSARYLLAVEVRPADRDGKPHFIRVAVKQRGATVRHRRVVIIPRAG